MIYGSPASGAGWIVPKAYYEKVGKDGFKQRPDRRRTVPLRQADGRHGARVRGVHRLLAQAAEHQDDRRARASRRRPPGSRCSRPARSTSPTRSRATCSTTMRKDPKLRMIAVQGNPTWLEMMSLDEPDHPLTDVRVRQAISLAIDRKAINDAELGGTLVDRRQLDPGGLAGRARPPGRRRPTSPRRRSSWPRPASPDGFEVSALTPLPPYFSWGERLVTPAPRRSTSRPR